MATVNEETHLLLTLHVYLLPVSLSPCLSVILPVTCLPVTCLPVYVSTCYLSTTGKEQRRGGINFN